MHLNTTQRRRTDTLVLIVELAAFFTLPLGRGQSAATIPACLQPHSLTSERSSNMLATMDSALGGKPGELQAGLGGPNGSLLSSPISSASVWSFGDGVDEMKLVQVQLLERMSLFHLRSLFYLITPGEMAERLGGNYTMDDHHHVPDYFTDAVPVFMLICLLEFFANFVLTGEGFRLNDTITSWSAGIISHMSKLCLKGVNTAIYVWLFRHYRLTTLPLDTWWAWVGALLATDLAYYWFHRASHEINLFWAAHQVHHSSEEFNLSVALRQSVVSNFGSWVFYLPMAVMGFTPASFLIHQHFNYLFQFWVHTSLVRNLGFLELFLNTPSHHRAHHGRNPQYIDVNYGGVLIIWDRLFGTFAYEDPKEPAFYGLVGRLESFNALWVQICRLYEIRRRIRANVSLSDKISAVLKGPRWRPGLPFLGVLERIPIRQKEDLPENRYDPQVLTWMNVYAAVHFLAVLPWFLAFIRHGDEWGAWEKTVSCLHIALSLCNIGSVFDNRRWIPHAEVLRCGLLGLVCSVLPGLEMYPSVVSCLRLLHGSSAFGWMGFLYTGINSKSAQIEKLKKSQ